MMTMFVGREGKSKIAMMTIGPRAGLGRLQKSGVKPGKGKMKCVCALKLLPYNSVGAVLCFRNVEKMFKNIFF